MATDKRKGNKKNNAGLGLTPPGGKRVPGAKKKGSKTKK